MAADTNAVQKKLAIQTWNAMAPKYHQRWSKRADGPWQSSREVVRLAGARPGHKILDVACGTGAVLGQIKKIPDTVAVGLDASMSALHIAKETGAHLVCADAESFAFHTRFDVATCQYGLFFLPDAHAALQNVRAHLIGGGVLAVSVHGENVPFHHVIPDQVRKMIPDYLQQGLDVTRYCRAPALEREMEEAGFSHINTTEFDFAFSPGTFDEYWNGHLAYAPDTAKRQLAGLDAQQLDRIRKGAKRASMRYEQNGRIVFPWQVLISTARA